MKEPTKEQSVTEIFYPYDVCLDGGFVGEHLTILAATEHAERVKRENPQSVVTILVSIDPRETEAREETPKAVRRGDGLRLYGSPDDPEMGSPS